ncbi:MAG: type II/IV secretion system protein, partial [Thermoguttaceae bacterium]
MAKRLNYLGILNRDGLLSRTQVQEAQELMKKTGVKMPEALKQLGYVNGEQIAKAIAEEHGKRYVDLKDVAIRPAVIELISESIARENCVLPYEEDGDALVVVVSDPDDVEVFEKLRFILQRPIESVVSSREAIQEAVNQHYGQNVGESADSMIHEMTDTAINFTVVEGAGGDEAQAGSGSESDAPI